MNQRIKVNSLIVFFNRLRMFLPLGKPIPISNSTSSNKPFFIIGSGRSGTTLLRSILNQTDKIQIPPESYVLPIIYKRYRVYRRLPWPNFVKIILGEFSSHPLFKYWEMDLAPLYQDLVKLEESRQSLRSIIDYIYSAYAAMHDKHNIILADKTPLNTYYLKEIDIMFDQPRYIHLKRDGRDVVASMLKFKLAENLEKACDRWLDSLSATKSMRQKSPDRILEIKYEELVKNTRGCVEHICQFVQIDFDEKMLNHTQNVEQLGDGVFDHHTNLAKSINTSSVGKWKSTLVQKDIDWIHNYMGKELRSEGYSID